MGKNQDKALRQVDLVDEICLALRVLYKLGLNAAEIARRTGCTPKHIGELLNAKKHATEYREDLCKLLVRELRAMATKPQYTSYYYSWGNGRKTMPEILDKVQAEMLAVRYGFALDPTLFRQISTLDAFRIVE